MATNNAGLDTVKEETLLLERLIALKKQLDDDGTDTQKNQNHRENNITNSNIISSKFKYRKINNFKTNAFIPTQTNKTSYLININNTKPNGHTNHNKSNSNVLYSQNNSMTSNVFIKPNTESVTHGKTILNEKNSNTLDNFNHLNGNHCIKKCSINQILKKGNFHGNFLPFDDSYPHVNISQIVINIDNYLNNVYSYMDASHYILEKKSEYNLRLNNPLKNYHSKNVYVNRKFQSKFSGNILKPIVKKQLIPVKKGLPSKRTVSKISNKLNDSQTHVKIGKTKLIKKSLINSNKYKLNNTSILLCKKTLQKPFTYNISINKSISSTQSFDENIENESMNINENTKTKFNTNKLKWTRPNILMVNNFNRLAESPKSDKLILFGSNKIIRQSLISSAQSKTNIYLSKHLSHRFALIRKLQLKNSNKKKITQLNCEQKNKNTTLCKKKMSDLLEKNSKRKNTIYSYINPNLSIIAEKVKFPINTLKKLPTGLTHNIHHMKNLVLPEDKLPPKSHMINSDKFSLNKKALSKQLCIVFNRLGICSKLIDGQCDKRHYKKYIALCTKYLSGDCSGKNCLLSHNIVKEKIPFCKHYLSGVCVQLNCQYLHEYRKPGTPICKKFLHGYCILGIKCPKNHLNICPIFETKNKCPHGQKCLYPHEKNVEKVKNDADNNELRYFETSIPKVTEISGNNNQIVPKRHAPLLDLPSYIPLN
ncbi:probable cyclin-dependent serine/threonine-protein kinase DDB_G0292550 isoform X2 [Daktulosphaira vitifoliae]|uniref:probable cyclin-dependent serine/threonine-protein kinase DDB_G0292550 isoform X2 n=1 Tax=Daktulosphaira vitifoliae TaxID=58002 RepID=UPI0021A99429|nr:probable cyclin-dependent serine/threonine-protein kinase DDB_G0292550 isoform X2 [Daktulosphaira vitifoliae]